MILLEFRIGGAVNVLLKPDSKMRVSAVNCVEV